MEKLLVVATHVDDETFGAGGLILRQKARGKQVYVLNMTHMSLESGYSKDQILQREGDIEKLIKAYDLDGYYNLKLKPAELDTYSRGELVKHVSCVINDIQPDTIILPFKNDVHSDHRVTFEVCYSCTKSFRYPFVKCVLMMEVLSETDFALAREGFKPNYYVDISQYLERKLEIASIFESETKAHPFPRSLRGVEALAVNRGANISVEYAEAYEVVKVIG